MRKMFVLLVRMDSNPLRLEKFARMELQWQPISPVVGSLAVHVVAVALLYPYQEESDIFHVDIML